MDIVLEKVTEIVDKIKKDKDLQELFMKDPTTAVEKLLDVDLPNDVIDNIIDGVKAKLAADKLGDVAGMFKKLF